MPRTIRLRADALAEMRAVSGHITDAHLARDMQVHRASVTRVLAGQQRPGEAFIAGLLSAYPSASFDELFEITDADAVSA